MLTLVKEHADARKELAKYFQLITENKISLCMFSDYIDKEWHEMLKDAEDYKGFCIQSCGQVIKHIPSHVKGASGHGDIDWVPLYESKFGKLDESWFKDSEGVTNQVVFDYYNRTGKILASWKCSAASCSGSGS